MSSGVIFLDQGELVSKIYRMHADNKYELISTEIKKLATRYPNGISASDIVIEAIIGALTYGSYFDVTEWRVYESNQFSQVVEDISLATGLRVVSLSSEKIKDLVCLGIIVEWNPLE